MDTRCAVSTLPRLEPEPLDQVPQRPQGGARALVIVCSGSTVRLRMVSAVCPAASILSRSPGNAIAPFARANPIDLAWVRYAVGWQAVERVIVCGHLRCHIMAGLIAVNQLHWPRGFARYSRYVRPALKKVAKRGLASDQERIRQLTVQNVLLQMEHLASYPEILAGLLDSRIQLEGWLHDPQTQNMQFLGLRSAQVRSASPSELTQ